MLSKFMQWEFKTMYIALKLTHQGERRHLASGVNIASEKVFFYDRYYSDTMIIIRNSTTHSDTVIMCCQATTQQEKNINNLIDRLRLRHTLDKIKCACICSLIRVFHG